MKNKKHQSWLEQSYELSFGRAPDTGIINRLFQTVLAAIGAYSCIYCFSSTFMLSISELFKYTAFVYLALIVALESWLLKKNWKIQWIVRIGGLLFWMIGNTENLQTGFYLIANRVIDLFNSYTGYHIKTFFIGQTLFKEEWFYISTVFELIFIIMAWLAVQVIVKHKSVWLYVIPSLLGITPAFAAGMVPAWKPFLIYIIFVFGLFGLSAIRLQAGRKKLYGKEEEIYFARLKIKTGMFLMAAAACTFAIVALAFGKGKYEKVEWIKPVKHHIQSGKWVDDATNIVKSKKNQGAGGLSDGKLGRYDKLQFDRKTDLEVTMGDFDKWKQPIYLKAFQGSNYQGDRWEKDKLEKEKKKELLEKGFSLEHQTADFYNLLNLWNMGRKDKEKASVGALYSYYSLKGTYMEKRYNFLDFIGSPIRINDVAADRRVKYTPYFSAQEESGSVFTYLNPDAFQAPYFVRRMGLNAGTEKEKNRQKDDVIKKAEAYQKGEEEYRKFVAETYKILPENFCKNIVKESREKYEQYKNKDVDKENSKVNYIGDIENTILSAIFSWKYRLDFYSGQNLAQYPDERGKDKNWVDEQTEIMRKIRFVQDYLKENAFYSLSPGKLQGQKDFIEDFIFEKKRGYCTHFASAAVIMLRALDIPARYVEGYVVKPEDIEAGVPDGGNTSYVEYHNNNAGTVKTKTVSVKDTNAHAWPEIYVDGYGWIPVEVTPGYDPEKDKKAEISPTPSSTSMPTPQVTETPTKSTPTPEIGKSGQDTQSPTVNFKLKVVWRILGLIIFTLAVYVIIRFREMCIRLIRKIRLRRMAKKEAALTMFRRSDSILRFMIKYKLPGFYRKDFNTLTADAIYGASKDLDNILSGWLGISISDCMDIVYKLRFSEETVSQKEYDKIKELYKNVRKYLYNDFCTTDQGNDRGFFGKWFYKFYCRRLKVY